MVDRTEYKVEAPPARTRCQVAIVGYGPVGMILAGLLAQRGLDVVAVEKYPYRYMMSRAGHIDGETMRTFQGLGIAEAVELVARPTTEFKFTDRNMEVLTELPISAGGSGWRDSYLAYQPELEAIFDARARELGTRVYRGVAGEALEQTDEGVRLTVRDLQNPDGIPAVIEADYVIGADGANSFVRQSIGVQRHDLGFRALDQLVLDFEHNDPDRDIPGLPEVYYVMDPERPVLAGRWQGGRWSRWEFAAVEGESREHLENVETAWQLLEPWGVTPEDGRIDRSAVYSFESTLAARWREGRVLLAGDAAHTMPPFMGQGMLSGIRDAVNLAWKLDDVINHRASERLLDSYESERAPHAEALIRMSMAVANLVLVRDPDRAQERDEMLRSGAMPPPPPFPRLGGGLARNETVDGGSAADGRLAPQGRVAADGRVDRFDSHGAAAWRIISRHAVPEEVQEQYAQLFETIGLEIAHISRGAGSDHFIDIDGEYDQWFRSNHCKAAVLRPDNYIFGLAETMDDLPELLNELRDALTVAGYPESDLADAEKTAMTMRGQ